MRIAMVGTGGVAQRHLGVLAQLPDVEIVAHVSSHSDRAALQSDRWSGRPYTSLAECLDHESPEAVWLCLIPDQHGPPEALLLERGVPFFVEKPLAVDLEPAVRIADAVQQARVITAVGYKFRALDTLPRVRALLDETPPRMVLGAWHDVMPPPAWWRQSRRSGGQIVEQATHLVDLARFLLGEGSLVSASGSRWPRRDAPDSDVADVSAALLHFGHITATFTASCILNRRHAIHLQLLCPGRVITITEQRVLIDGSEAFTTSADPFLVEDAAFLDAVRSNDPSRALCTYADALETHRLCCAIRDAMAGNARSS